MQELSERLKNSLVKSLIRNEQNVDEPYLYSNGKHWTRREISEEIKNETEFGISQMTNIMVLSLDIIARNNTNLKND